MSLPLSSPNSPGDHSEALQSEKKTFEHRRTHSTEETNTQGGSRDRGWNTESTDSGEHSFVQRGDNIDIGTGVLRTPPPATRTSRPGSRNIPITKDDEDFPASRIQHRSLPAVVPGSQSRISLESLNRKALPRRETEDEYMAGSVTDKNGVPERTTKGGIASWFTGSSTPVTMGAPVAEPQSSPTSSIISSREITFERTGPIFTELPTRTLRKRPTLPTLEPAMSTPSPAQHKLPSAGIGSRFNFFSSTKTPTKTPTITQIPASLNDEFLDLDVGYALFPAGAPSEQDPFSPAAFKNLLMNAEGLLLRLQTAYKLRTISLHELTSENSAIKEELEEAETRAQCLRSQLEGLGKQVSEQETTITDLVNELAVEKKARAEEKEARVQSEALLHTLQRQIRDREKRISTASLTVDTAGVEDLGIDSASLDRKHWRSSGASTQLSIEIDSDGESAGAESIFSRSMSPALTMDSGMSIISTTENTPFPSRGNTPSRPKAVQQRSTFQKMLGMGGGGNGGGELEVPKGDAGRDRFGGIGLGEEGCSNCRGKDASVAWDTVGLLRAENMGLKERVGQMEGVIEGALRLCC